MKDRLEVIAAGEIAERSTEAKGSKYASPSIRGPLLVATFVKPEDRNDALWAALEGRDVGVRPKFFVDYGSQIEPIKQKLKPLSVLRRRNQEFDQIIGKALRELERPAEDFGWLPVKHTRGFLDRAGGSTDGLSREVRADRPVLRRRRRLA